MRAVILTLAALLLTGAAASAREVTPAEQRLIPYNGDLPSCDDSWVLQRITDRFGQKESEYWNSTLQISGYDKVREIGFRANGLDYIPRRYCVARATLSDQKLHTVIYEIGENLGIIGWGYGVEWCVVGLDRNFAYAPGCSVLRPFVDRSLGAAAGVLRERY